MSHNESIITYPVFAALCCTEWCVHAWKATCLSFWANRVHSAPSLLVISGNGKSGYRARMCSLRSFRKRTYPVTGALGPFGSTFFLFLPFGQPLFFGYKEKQKKYSLIIHKTATKWSCSANCFNGQLRATTVLFPFILAYNNKKEIILKNIDCRSSPCL